MAWARVQSAGANTFGTSLTATFSTANVSSGNKIIAYVGSSWSDAPTSVKDGGGTSWTQLGSKPTGTGSVWLYGLDVPAGDAGTKPGITVIFPSSNGQSLLVQEVSGLLAGNTTAMIDGTPGTLSGTASSTGSPTYSSTASNEYLACCYADDNGNSTVAAASGFTLDANNQHTFSSVQVEYANSTGGSETSGFTTASTDGWAILTVAFKLAAAASSGRSLIVPQAVKRAAFY